MCRPYQLTRMPKIFTHSHTYIHTQPHAHIHARMHAPCVWRAHRSRELRNIGVDSRRKVGGGVGGMQAREYVVVVHRLCGFMKPARPTK